jgi:hypothetical protein
MSRITDRVVRATGIPDLLDVLTRLPPTDLQSLLLDVFSRRASGLAAPDVLAATSVAASLDSPRPIRVLSSSSTGWPSPSRRRRSSRSSWRRSCRSALSRR